MVISSSSQQFANGDLALKAPQASIELVFDYSQDLAAAGSPPPRIADSSFAISPVPPHVDADLESTGDDMLSGQSTRIMVSGGTRGTTYEITNVVTTNASPNETWVGTLRVLIE